jgi:large subunit ribosomal protein L30
MSNTQKMISVTLLKSISGRKKNHIACALGLGLKRIHQTKNVIDTPENRGMINEISYLVSWKVVE